MRAVNLLPPDLRSGPKGSAPAVSSGVENSGAGAFVVLGVLALCVFALAAYVLAGNTVKDRKAELAAATAAGGCRRAAGRCAEALRRLRVRRQRARPDRHGPGQLPLRLGAGAARPLARRPRRRDDRLASRATSARPSGGASGGGIRGAITAPGDHARRLHLRPDQGRRADGPPARRRRRHPRVARRSPTRRPRRGRRHRRRPQGAQRDRLLRHAPASPRSSWSCSSRAPPPRAGPRAGAAAATADDRCGRGDAAPAAGAATPAAGTAAPAATPAAGPRPPPRRRLRQPRPPRLDDSLGLRPVTKNKTAPDRGRRDRGGSRRLLVPRPRAQARGGGEAATARSPRSRPSSRPPSRRWPPTRGSKAATAATTPPSSGSARPCRSDDDVRSLLVQLDAEAGGTRRRLPHDPGRRRAQRSRAGRRRAGAGAVAAPGRGHRRHGRLLADAVHLLLPRHASSTCRSFFARLERFVTLRNEKHRTSRAGCCALESSTSRSTRPASRTSARSRRHLVPGPRTQGITAGATPAGPRGRRPRRPRLRRRPRRPTTPATVTGAIR